MRRAQVGRQGVRGGDGVLTDVERDRAVAAGGAHELLDGPAGAFPDEPGDREGGEHDVEMGLDPLRLWR